MPGKKQTASSSAQAASSAVTRTIKTRRERLEDEAERKRQRVENTPDVTHGGDGDDDHDSEKSETRDDDDGGDSEKKFRARWEISSLPELQRERDIELRKIESERTNIIKAHRDASPERIEQRQRNLRELRWVMDRECVDPRTIEQREFKYRNAQG